MITIFVDTNILFCSDDNLKEVRFIKNIQKIISEVEINDIYSEVKIVIPLLVIYELFEQQIEDYEDWINKLRNLKMPNMTLDINYNYRDYLSNLFREEIEGLRKKLVKIEIAEFPKEDKLENIIHRAIKKQAPFEGKTKKSDKGFKDVVIWETIKEYKNKHIGDTIILYCNDNLLTDTELATEYSEEFRDKIYTAKKGQLIECLTKLLNKTMINSFSEQLEERLKNILSEYNPAFYELLMNDNVWQDGDEILSFIVEDLYILNCDDKKINNRIKYDVRISIKLQYLDNVIRGTYKENNFRDLEIFYDFDVDDFLIKEYDTLLLGRCILNDFYSLTKGNND